MDAWECAQVKQDRRVSLSVKEISKSFVGVQALADVSVDFRRGSITALLAVNGSGKSTLIKILAGFHAPDAGSASVRGVDLPLPSTADALRDLGLRFVHQDLGLVDELTVADNFGLATGSGPAPSWVRSRSAPSAIALRKRSERSISGCQATTGWVTCRRPNACW